MGHYVYKYVFNGEIIYIGKCDSDLDQRLAQHGKPGDNIDKKYWDDINASDIYYCTLANETMSDVVESELIRGMSIIGVYEFNENEVILFLKSYVCKNWHELLDLVINSRVKEFHHNLEVINANHKRLVSLYNSDDDCSLKCVLLGYILSGIHVNMFITDEEIVNFLTAIKAF